MSEILYWLEDFTPGRVFHLTPREITSSEIIEFASEFDPQPFHLSEDAGKASILGGLAASGWHTCSIAMRLFVDAILQHAAGEGSPGVDFTEQVLLCSFCECFYQKIVFRVRGLRASWIRTSGGVGGSVISQIAKGSQDRFDAM